MTARSAALACASARLDSTSRRTRPHTSTSQLTDPLSEYWLPTELPFEPAPLPPPEPDRVTSAPAPMVGKKPARALRTSAWAWR
ncbi:Uncharacterised protein [Bordetella pertussis]|nr:Uncharacterised protein [Bordetella pertussis]CFV98080.1 Uncharacterised protein [Bordetella pertussis]